MKILKQRIWKNNYFNNKKGITLITLVITIVIILILATVVIASVTDQDKNLVDRTKDTKKDFEAKQETEILQNILIDVQGLNFANDTEKTNYIEKALSEEGVFNFEVYIDSAVIRGRLYYFEDLIPGFNEL